MTEGRATLKAELPIWRSTHDAVDAALSAVGPDDLRQGLKELA